MTLHIALVTEAFVLQVGDRLLSVGDNPWDSKANKTIIVEATNGRAVIGYAGLAHVRAEPTGEWLTRKLTGSQAPHEWNQFGRGPRLHLGEVRDRIVRALENELAIGQRARPRHGLEILMSAWSYPRLVHKASRRPTSWSCTIVHTGNPGSRSRVERGPRFQYRELSKKGWYSAIGRADLIDLAAVHKKLSSLDSHITPQRAEPLLVEAIREIAMIPRSGVGTDVMSVYLNPVPWTFQQHAHYYRDVSLGDERVGYAPAIIAPTGIFPPQRMTRSGGHALVFDGETRYQYDMETIPPWPETPGVQSFGPVMGKPWR